MAQRLPATTATLYEVDETAWLEATADLVRQGRFDEIERETLAEYLTDMAKRDRRDCGGKGMLRQHPTRAD